MTRIVKRHEFDVSSATGERRRRRYHGGCAVAHALDLLGNRWTIPIIKELLFGGMRFSALKSRLPGIGPNVLTQRLVELEEEGLVRQRYLADPVPAKIYELTERALRTRPLIVGLARWGVRSSCFEVTPPLSVASLMILLEAALDPAAAAGFECQMGIAVGQDAFGIAISAGTIRVSSGKPSDPDATVSGSTTAISQFIFSGAPLEQLRLEGRIDAAGDLNIVRKLPSMFCPV